MSFTRRGVVAAGMTTLVSTFAGCQSVRPDFTARPGTTDDGTSGSGSDVEVRLEGPGTDQVLFDGTHVASLGEIEQRHGPYSFLVTFTADGTERVSDRFRSADVDATPDEFEVVNYQGDTELSRSGITEELAVRVVNDEWDGKLVMQFEDQETAREVRQALAAGN